MDYRTFVTYNIFGGVLWVFSTTLLGYSVGRAIPEIDKYLHLVIAIVVVLSLIPAFYEWRKARRENQRISRDTAL
jgi:membrane-associated protein